MFPWEDHLWASWHGCDGGSPRVHWCERCGQSWGHDAWERSKTNDKGFCMNFKDMIKCDVGIALTIKCVNILLSRSVKYLADMVMHVWGFTQCHSSLSWKARKTVFNYLPGAGELITGPTVLGDVMAAGNLICASPPYLITITTEELLLVCVQCEWVQICPCV